MQGGVLQASAGHVEGVVGGLEAAVEEADVAGVYAALERLEPVAVLQALGEVAIVVGAGRPREVGQLRLEVGRAHVGPDNAATLLAGVGGDAHLVLEVALGGLGRHVDAVAVHVELPAVVDAAEAVLLVPAEEEAGPPVGAEVVEQANVAVGVTERDEALSEDAHTSGGTVGNGDLFREQGGDPVATQILAHGGVGPHAGEECVVFSVEHEPPPPIVRLGYTRRARRAATKMGRCVAAHPRMCTGAYWLRIRSLRQSAC